MSTSAFAVNCTPEIKFSCTVPRMVDLIEAHRLTGLSIPFLRHKFRAGELVGVRCGVSNNGKILLNFDKLVEYLNCHREQLESEPEYITGQIHPVKI